MAKVWMIEQGEYSDKRVVGVFSTAELPERSPSSAGGFA